MNYSDSERIATQLEKSGFSAALLPKKAALVVVNSCSVRQTAEDRVFSYIHNLWKNHPQTKIILTGCLAGRKDVQKRLKNKVALFMSIDKINSLEKFIEKNIHNSKFIIHNSSYSKGSHPYFNIQPKYTNKHTAYIPIMTGCNNFCAYCVVPYARGREISRPTEDIISEVKNLIKRGYKHIVLLGQNVNSYKSGIKRSPTSFGRLGREKSDFYNFSELLKKINALPGHFWISFISNHPKDFSEELIKTATQLPRVCEFIHLPLQAGDNQILKKMNRHYTQADYLKLVAKIKKSFQKYKPGKLYSLTSDIIVGFPGETKKQFLESAKVMEKAKFDMVYFGQYSPRPGTAAYQLKNNITKPEKSRREKYLNEILKKTSYENNQKYLGQTLEVLIDKKEKDAYFGRTRTMKNVKLISSKKNLIGKFIKAKIIKANIWNLEGLCHPTDGRP